MAELNASALSRPEEANDIHVDERHFIQIQSNGRFVQRHLGLEFLEMIRPNPANEPQDRVWALGHIFDLQHRITSSSVKFGFAKARSKPKPREDAAIWLSSSK